MADSTPQIPRDQLVAAVRCDPKRTGLMLGTLAMIVMMLLRLASNGPGSAAASSIARKNPVPIEPIEPQRATVSGPVLNWLSQPPKPVERNLFALPTQYYTAQVPDAEPAESPEDPAKSVGSATDQDKELHVLMQTLQSQAGKLKLQATMMGPVRCALVNGELVKEGDIINGLTVAKIEPRRMVLARGSATLEIEMP